MFEFKKANLVHLNVSSEGNRFSCLKSKKSVINYLFASTISGTHIFFGSTRIRSILPYFTGSHCRNGLVQFYKAMHGKHSGPLLLALS